MGETLSKEAVRNGKHDKYIVRRLRQASKDPDYRNARWLLEDAASEIIHWRVIACFLLAGILSLADWAWANS